MHVACVAARVAGIVVVDKILPSAFASPGLLPSPGVEAPGSGHSADLADSSSSSTNSSSNALSPTLSPTLSPLTPTSFAAARFTPPPSKRPRLLHSAMQDQTPASSLAVQTSAGARSVASRLKKSLVSPAGHNGAAAAGPERLPSQDNGHAALSQRIQLSPVNQEILRVIGQYLKSLGMQSVSCFPLFHSAESSVLSSCTDCTQRQWKGL